MISNKVVNLWRPRTELCAVFTQTDLRLLGSTEKDLQSERGENGNTEAQESGSLGLPYLCFYLLVLSNEALFN